MVSCILILIYLSSIGVRSQMDIEDCATFGTVSDWEKKFVECHTHDKYDTKPRGKDVCPKGMKIDPFEGDEYVIHKRDMTVDACNPGVCKKSHQHWVPTNKCDKTCHFICRGDLTQSNHVPNQLCKYGSCDAGYNQEGYRCLVDNGLMEAALWRQPDPSYEEMDKICKSKLRGSQSEQTGYHVGYDRTMKITNKKQRGPIIMCTSGSRKLSYIGKQLVCRRKTTLEVQEEQQQQNQVEKSTEDMLLDINNLKAQKEALDKREQELIAHNKQLSDKIKEMKKKMQITQSGNEDVQLQIAHKNDANVEYFDDLEEADGSSVYSQDYHTSYLYSSNILLTSGLLLIFLCGLASILCCGSGVILALFGCLYHQKQKQSETNQCPHDYDLTI